MFCLILFIRQWFERLLRLYRREGKSTDKEKVQKKESSQEEPRTKSRPPEDPEKETQENSEKKSKVFLIIRFSEISFVKSVFLVKKTDSNHLRK